jgi:hypothetical protein
MYPTIPLATGDYILNVNNGISSWKTVNAESAIKPTMVDVNIKTSPPPSVNWLFIAAGQSNCQSYTKASINWTEDATDPRIRQWSRGINTKNYTAPKSDVWITAQYPLQFPSILPATNHIGGQLNFSKAFLNDHPDDTVSWVCSAVGGTGFTAVDFGYGECSWLYGYKGPGRNLFKEMIEDVQKALLNSPPNTKFGGFIWIQGEADCGMHPQLYQKYLSKMIDRTRHLLGDPNIPVMVGTMLSSWVAEFESRKHIDHVHRTVAQFIWLAGTIDMTKVETGIMTDVVHYNAETQRAGGYLMYNVWVNLQLIYQQALEEWKANQQQYKVGKIVN